MTGPIVVIPTDLRDPLKKTMKKGTAGKKKAPVAFGSSVQAATAPAGPASSAARPNPAARQQTLQDFAFTRIKELEAMNQTLAEALAQIREESAAESERLRSEAARLEEELAQAGARVAEAATSRSLEVHQLQTQVQDYYQQVSSLEAQLRGLAEKVKCGKQQRESLKARLREEQQRARDAEVSTAERVRELEAAVGGRAREAEGAAAGRMREAEARWEGAARDLERRAREAEAGQAMASAQLSDALESRDALRRRLSDAEAELEVSRREVKASRADLLDAQAKCVVLEEVTRAMKDLQGAATAKQVEADELAAQLRAARGQIEDLQEAVDRRDVMLQNTQQLKDQLREKQAVIDTITLELDQERAARRRQSLALEEEASRYKRAATDVARALEGEERAKLACQRALQESRLECRKLEGVVGERDAEVQGLRSRAAALEESARAAEERAKEGEEALRAAQRRAYQYRQENHVLLGQYEAWLRAMLQPAPANQGPAPPAEVGPLLGISQAHKPPLSAPGAQLHSAAAAVPSVAGRALSTAAFASGSPAAGVSMGPEGDRERRDRLPGPDPSSMDDRLARLIEEKREARLRRREKEREERVGGAGLSGEESLELTDGGLYESDRDD